MNNKKIILEHLKKNQCDNLNIINFIESYPIHHFERVGDSVFIKGTSDRKWIYISSKCKKELQLIKNKLAKEDKCFAIIEDWMLPILTDGVKVKWKLSTARLVLIRDVDLPKSTCKTENLTLEDSKFIYDNSDYKEFLSIDYIKERITNGISSCVRIKGNPVAWGMTQDDGAIGFLHVLPEHRKNGYAKAVTLDIIKKVKNAQEIPFVHIEESNENSMNLAMGLGFQKDRVVNWLEIE